MEISTWRLTLSEDSGHRPVLPPAEAGGLVQPNRGDVFVGNFKQQRANVQLSRLSCDEFDHSSANALAPEVSVDEQLIHECDASSELDAHAKGQRDVSNGVL